jgi:hypothetical protein
MCGAIGRDVIMPGADMPRMKREESDGEAPGDAGGSQLVVWRDFKPSLFTPSSSATAVRAAA